MAHANTTNAREKRKKIIMQTQLFLECVAQTQLFLLHSPLSPPWCPRGAVEPPRPLHCAYVPCCAPQQPRDSPLCALPRLPPPQSKADGVDPTPLSARAQPGIRWDGPR